MNKIFAIIQREFITRVRKKSFIIMTILGPILFAGIMVVPIWLATQDISDQKVIQVIDNSGLFEDKFQTNNEIRFEYVESHLEAAKEDLSNDELDGLLYIPELNVDDPDGITLFSSKSPSLEVVKSIKNTLNGEIRELKVKQMGLDRQVLDNLKTNVDIETISMTSDGEKKASAEINTIVGFVGGFILYFFIFIYGAQVMRGVIEEKTSRIVEIIISSVRPFQLMMGKIIGVASVGLAQFLLWIILTTIIYGFISNTFGINRFDQIQNQEIMAETEQQIETMDGLSGALQSIESINIPLILISFVIYFMGGYFLYGALFAAVGSAADNETDTQQFMLPITIPLIFSIMMLNAVLKDPDGSLAFWLSMVPFTSPVIMMMRLPFGVPFWELSLSIFLLVLGFVGTTWMAGKIYRIGILIHGSKVNYKVLGKWILMK